MKKDWKLVFRKREKDDDLFKDKKDEEFLTILIEMFDRWDKEVQAERERQKTKGYFSDTLENELKEFAESCVYWCVRKYDTPGFPSEDEEGWKTLYSYRHFAYGFYRLYDFEKSVMRRKGEPGEEVLPNLKRILSKDDNENVLYLALTDYFQNFYGTFHDNELAIRIICEYYPDNAHFKESDEKRIVQGLSQHITTAGSERDRGYAFNGISLIVQWIHRLPTSVVKQLLEEYRCPSITNEVIRHQIHAIIINSNMEDREKWKYKFIYLDSMLLLLSIEPILYPMWCSDDIRLDLDRNMMNCVEPEVTFLKQKWPGEEDEIRYAWWSLKEEISDVCKIRRCLFKKDGIFLEILLDMQDVCAGRNGVYIKCEDIVTKNKSFHFDQDDWLLDQYESRAFAEELQEMFNKSNKQDKGFLFSHVYLNQYRGLKEQQLSFDHKFSFENKVIKLRRETNPGVEIYGRSIHSLNCIVGKNGTGKTGIMDFLRDSFFGLLDELHNCPEVYEGQVLKVNNFRRFGLEKNTEFLIIFMLGKNCYFLTNIEDIQCECSGVEAYPGDKLLNKHNNSKVLYFSNKIDGNGVGILRGIQLHEPNDRFVDYSSAASYSSRLKAYSEISPVKDLAATPVGAEEKDIEGYFSYVNLELCYQLAFLDSHNEKELNEFLGWDLKKDSLIFIPDDRDDNKVGGWIKGNLKEQINSPYLRGLLSNPTSGIGYFSSGQFSKMDFYSKLYWCLEGYQNYIEAFKTVIGKNGFSISGVLQPGDTAVIFIDEGELYYHPEWQRRYLDNLLAMIQKYGKEVLLQIIITTNSPFILSDIRNRDITYLPRTAHERNNDTFGQNIHTLLKHNFYMDATIGEVSKKCIECLTLLLRERDDKTERNAITATDWLNWYLDKQKTHENSEKSLNSQEAYELLSAFIQEIGERIYREELMEMLDNCWNVVDEKRELNRLREQVRRLERKIQGAE